MSTPQQPWGPPPQQPQQPQQPQPGLGQYGQQPGPYGQAAPGQPAPWGQQGQPGQAQPLPAYGQPVGQPSASAPQSGYGPAPAGWSAPGGFQPAQPQPGQPQPVQPQPPYAGTPPMQGYGQVPPAAPKKGGSGKIMALILVPLLLLGGIGGGLALIGGGKDDPSPKPVPTINPTTPSRPSSSTSTKPSTSTSANPTMPTAPASSGPATAGAVAVGGGVEVKLPDGWSIDEQSDGEVVITDGHDFLLVQVVGGSKSTKASTLVDSWLTKQKTYFQNPKVTGTSPVTLKPTPAKPYNAADAGLHGTMTTQSGSADVLLFMVVFVRETDGLAVAVTELAGSSSAAKTDKVFTDVASQAASTLLR